VCRATATSNPTAVDLAVPAAFSRGFGRFATGGCDPRNLTGSGATIHLDDLVLFVDTLTGLG